MITQSRFAHCRAKPYLWALLYRMAGLQNASFSVFYNFAKVTGSLFSSVAMHTVTHAAVTHYKFVHTDVAN